MADPVVRQNALAALNTPEARNKRQATKSTPAYKQKWSAAAKKGWARRKAAQAPVQTKGKYTITLVGPGKYIYTLTG